MEFGVTGIYSSIYQNNTYDAVKTLMYGIRLF